MALQKVSMIWSSEPMTLGSRRRASISAGSSSMPNSPLSQACTASLGASFRRDSKRCRSRMSWKYAHCRLQVQGAQRRQQHLPSAFAAVGYMPRWLGRFWIVSTRDEKNRGADRRSENVARIGLEPVWKGHILAASRLTINWIMAIRIHASVVSGKASKSLLNRRERLSQAKERSTIQPQCRTRVGKL